MMENLIVKKSLIHGKGLFTTKPYKKGDIVLDWSKHSEILLKHEVEKLTKEKRKFVSKIDGKYILFKNKARMVNHSCNSNTKVKDNSNVATIDIKEGEEITTNYNLEGATIEGKCNCGVHNLPSKEIKISIINSLGEKLIGLKATPNILAKKNPAMILVHGFAYYKEEDGLFDDFAKRLAEKGIIVYRFDFSGCGESEGDFSKSSLTKLKNELNQIIDYIKADPTVDIQKIGVLSQSFGTTTTIALHPKVKCMVMLGTLAHPKELLSNHFGSGYNPNGISIRKRSNGNITKVEKSFWEDLDNYNILKLVKEIQCPILFAHGEKDHIVPSTNMDLVYENANQPKEKMVIKNADHDMLPSRKILYSVVVPWVSKNLI